MPSRVDERRELGERFGHVVAVRDEHVLQARPAREPRRVQQVLEPDVRLVVRIRDAHRRARERQQHGLTALVAAHSVGEHGGIFNGDTRIRDGRLVATEDGAAT